MTRFVVAAIVGLVIGYSLGVATKPKHQDHLTTFSGYSVMVGGGDSGAYEIKFYGGGGTGGCGSYARRCTCGMTHRKEFGDFLPYVADLPHEVRRDMLAKRGGQLMVAC